jgi:hypothetical protein
VLSIGSEKANEKAKNMIPPESFPNGPSLYLEKRADGGGKGKGD